MPVPSRKELQALKRPELQALCKDYGVKANLKTDALIELLLDTKKTNTRAPAAPATRRSVSTRQPSRSAPRISSVIIHDTDDEDEEEENAPEVDEEETENQPQPQPDPEPTSIPSNRTRKAKDTQTRLGVGRPVAAGGNGARAVTKSVSVAKGKRGRNSKAVKKPVEETIPEDAEEEQPLQEQAGPSDIAVAVPATAPPEPPAPEASTSNESTALAKAVADAMQPVHQQMQSLKSELEQLRKQVAGMQHLEQKVATLTAQVDALKAQSVTRTILDAELKQVEDMVATNNSRSVPNPSTPRFLSPAPRSNLNENAEASSSNSKTISPIKNHELPNPGVAPSMLGKRSRDSTSSNLTGIIEEGQEEDLSEEELAKRVVRPTKKRAKLQEKPQEDFEIDQDSGGPSAPRVPSFTVFSGEEDPYIDPPPPTEGLPTFYAATASPSDNGPRQGTTTSTQNASENQHPFSFAFLPIASTPAGNSAFELPSFPYPEPPQSPTPAGPSNSGPARNHGERTDIFQPFGLPPPGRPRSRVTSTSASSSTSRDFVDPIALTRRASDQEGRDEFGGFLRDSDREAQALKRTMYGTELDGDTRFGDFGFEGVASGFNWPRGSSDLWIRFVQPLLTAGPQWKVQEYHRSSVNVSVLVSCISTDRFFFFTL
ncbi:hypothetical protein MSAN_02149500 [Mycena sanguinolenta]|uniref:Uncharacterized protein n=1 Tax=Mycena sanguinolenta TaxID=230812 RepID=A0A8H7CKC7_9AGAR|nr:hypothetical protein MSAN_02149500 [Mycena sanguinolenta]